MTEFNAETRFGRVVWERALRNNITNLSRFSQTTAEYDERTHHEVPTSMKTFG